MADRIKTFLIEDGGPKTEIGKHPEKRDGELFFYAGVRYRIRSASHFEYRRQREQELRVTREG